VSGHHLGLDVIHVVPELRGLDADEIRTQLRAFPGASGVVRGGRAPSESTRLREAEGMSDGGGDDGGWQ